MHILSMFNTGQVTLPKKWRQQFNASKFIARPQGKKLIIEPIEDDTPDQLQDENVELFEDEKKGQKISGIRFKKGLSDESLKYFKTALKNA